MLACVSVAFPPAPEFEFMEARMVDDIVQNVRVHGTRYGRRAFDVGENRSM